MTAAPTTKSNYSTKNPMFNNGQKGGENKEKDLLIIGNEL